MLQAASIIPREMQIGETHEHTCNLQQNPKEKNIKLKMQTYMLSL